MRIADERELSRLDPSLAGRTAGYRWLEAARGYERAAEEARSRGDVESTVRLEDALALCYLRSAFQSPQKASFLPKIRAAESAYVRSSRSASQLPDSLRPAFSAKSAGHLCSAQSLHARSSGERQRLLRRCSQLRREALAHFETLGRGDETVAAALDYLEALGNELEMEWAVPGRRTIIAEGLRVGEDAFSKTPASKLDLAWMNYHLGALSRRQEFLLEDASARRHAKQRSIDYTMKAIELSAPGDDKFLLSKASLLAISALGYGSRSPELFRGYLSVSLESARLTGDGRLIGDALAAAAYDLTWDMVSEEIPERRITKFEECKRLVDEAVEKYDAVLCEEGSAAVRGISLAHAYYRASFGVADKARRGELLDEAAKIGTSAFQSFVRTRSIGLSGPLDNTPAQILAFVLVQQALLATENQKKRALFEKAGELARETFKYRESFEPFNNWDKGADLDTEASVQAELAKITADKRQRLRLLTIVSRKEQAALALCKLHFATTSELPVIMAVSMGAIANRMYRAYREIYRLTGEGEARASMIAALQEMADFYPKAGWPSRAAQAHWRLAQLCDEVRADAQASEEFDAASRLFRSAAESIPSFGEYFTDYSRYMQAWSSISKARAATKAQAYDQASADYARSSELLKGTRRWAGASTYFDAWSKLQTAEACSATEKFSEAVRAFDDARDLFSLALRTEEREPDLAIVAVEDHLDISSAASVRMRYCQGRAALEMARRPDLEEEKRSSSQYDQASWIFKEIADGIPPGAERDEFMSMSLLCQGWKLLREGEADRSGELFARAARRFDEASKLRVGEKASSVATANFHYCEAMREGLEFGETGDEDFYANAKRHMEAARRGYADADMQRNAIWTEATMSVLDARLYLFNGEASDDPTGKAKFYKLAEKSLGLALYLAESAAYKSRMIPVEKELVRLRRKSEVAQDLAQILAAPPVTAHGSLVQARPQEEAEGLAAFEGVNLQGQLRHEKQVEVGDTFDLQLDVFNSGNRPASLLKIEEIAPGGLRLVSAQEPYLVQGTSLDTKDLLVQPLRIQSFHVSLMAQDAGEQTLAPRLVYKDETGVKSLPLLSTRVRVLPQSAFEFRSSEANLIFEFLVRGFVSDYMHQKLSPEQSGWRTRGQIEKEGGAVKSALYGPQGKYAAPLYELLSRGLVESRTFSGQRGRGGETTKLRISYDKETVKRYVDKLAKSAR